MATTQTSRPQAHLSKRLAPPHAHAHARPQRPTSHNKRTHSHKGSTTKPGPPQPTDEDDDFMAASFLQFCATCERQIVTPCNSLLYCSESCRKRDRRASYYTDDYSPPTSPYSTMTFDYADLPAPKDIVTPRSPTAPSKRSSIALSESSDSDSTTQPPAARPHHNRQNSEAARYLRQFQSTSLSLSTSTRPHYHRSSTSLSTTTNPTTTTTTILPTPSLSQTPNSTASLSMPYTPALSYHRPLPPRHNPQGARSIDLVTPYAIYPTTAPGSLSAYSFKAAPSAEMTHGVATGEMRYEKVEFAGPPGSGGSLGRLLMETS